MSAQEHSRKNMWSETKGKSLESGSFFTVNSSGDESIDVELKKKVELKTVTSTSPMNTSDEEQVLDGGTVKHIRSPESSGSKHKAKLLNKKKKDAIRLSDRMILVQKENCALRRRIGRLEKTRAMYDLNTKKKLESLQGLVDERNRQVKELWDVIQLLDDANLKLKCQVEKLDEREKTLNNEIFGLKLCITNSDVGGAIVCSNSENWKEKVDQESSVRGSTSLNKVRNIARPHNEKLDGRCKRLSHRDVKQSRLETTIHEHVYCAISKTGKSFADEDDKRRKSSEKKVLDNEKSTNFPNGRSTEDVTSNHCGYEGGIWGSGLWPPEWTTVRTVDQQKHRSSTWEVH